MASLVADYGTSGSESKSEESDSDNEDVSQGPDEKSQSKLPLPSFTGGNISVENSVFVNPFVEAENAEKALLEKHVKMIPTKDSITSIDGKKICWMYRKGRCRFGHRCKFAHDSDLYTVNSKEEGNLSDGEQPKPKKKKKRPGLSSQLVPGRKVMKMYHQQKQNNGAL